MEHVRDAPQQSNGFDCGMYTVLLARRLASEAAGTPVTPAPPPVVVEADAAVAAVTVVASSGESKMPDQDKAAALAAGERVEGSSGCGGDGEGVSAATERESSGEEASAKGVTMSISPAFASNERTLARERLLRCIRKQRWC